MQPQLVQVQGRDRVSAVRERRVITSQHLSIPLLSPASLMSTLQQEGWLELVGG